MEKDKEKMAWYSTLATPSPNSQKAERIREHKFAMKDRKCPLCYTVEDDINCIMMHFLF